MFEAPLHLSHEYSNRLAPHYLANTKWVPFLVALGDTSFQLSNTKWHCCIVWATQMQVLDNCFLELVTPGQAKMPKCLWWTLKLTGSLQHCDLPEVWVFGESMNLREGYLKATCGNSGHGKRSSLCFCSDTISWALDGGFWLWLPWSWGPYVVESWLLLCPLGTHGFLPMTLQHPWCLASLLLKWVCPLPHCGGHTTCDTQGGYL